MGRRAARGLGSGVGRRPAPRVVVGAPSDGALALHRVGHQRGDHGQGGLVVAGEGGHRPGSRPRGRRPAAPKAIAGTASWLWASGRPGTGIVPGRDVAAVLVGPAHAARVLAHLAQVPDPQRRAAGGRHADEPLADGHLRADALGLVAAAGDREEAPPVLVEQQHERVLVAEQLGQARRRWRSRTVSRSLGPRQPSGQLGQRRRPARPSIGRPAPPPASSGRSAALGTSSMSSTR